MRRFIILFVLLASLSLSACDNDWENNDYENYYNNSEYYKENSDIEDTQPPPQPTEEPVIEPPAMDSSPEEPSMTKLDLWASGETLLRGANIWQAIVIPALDGLEFKGSGPVGPPFTQEDFDRLAALGANYVTISGPGLFTEKPPYEPAPEVVAYIDELVEMITNADMFVTIAFRTGPGRSEYTLCCEGEDWAYGYFNDKVWQEEEAQEGWVEMWRFTAEHFRDNPYVVGYKLMVEPNAAGTFFDIWEPEEFYDNYAGTTYDWNQFYPRIVQAIREVDPETPILVNAEGYSAIEWLPYIKPVDAYGVVYIAHHYDPYEQYTNQDPWLGNTYPGLYDVDWDGVPDEYDRDWLDGQLSIVHDFSSDYDVPVGIDEFGVVRWAPGAEDYMDDLMGLFEKYGWNYSLWEWSTSWWPFVSDVNAFTFLFGPDLDNTSEVDNDLFDVITTYWSRNTLRPSNAPWIVGDE
jgi:hypothetical protein